MEFKDSRTYANLMAAFAGESQARTKYTAYGQMARQEGYEQIGDIFDETSANEFVHASQWLKYIHGGNLPSTLPALEDAAGGEHYEWSEMYKQFAEEARTEGYTKIAASFELVAKVEKEHEERYRKLIDNLNQNKVFHKDTEVVWICRYCGHIHHGKDAPTTCPICGKPQAYFEERKENY